MTVDDVAKLLAGFRLRYGTERQLQDDVERALEAERIPFIRECRTSTGPIDFLVEGAIGVECKIAGGASQVLPQLQRYAAEPQIAGIVLVTSRPTHRFGVETLGGVPFRTLWIAGNL